MKQKQPRCYWVTAGWMERTTYEDRSFRVYAWDAEDAMTQVLLELRHYDEPRIVRVQPYVDQGQDRKLSRPDFPANVPVNG